MITAILFQVLQLYRLCKFATDTTVLSVILPHIAPHECPNYQFMAQPYSEKGVTLPFFAKFCAIISNVAQ
jgi:hypothetical protein